MPLDLLQFHGDETPADCERHGRPYIKAVRVNQDTDLLKCAAEFDSARGLLLDAYVPGVAGGTGERFDWSLIPPDLPGSVILSGGLTPDNVAEAVRAGTPLGSRCVLRRKNEHGMPKGIKDAQKIAQFIAKAKSIMKLTDFPDSHGHFGPYGGVFVAETLMAALDELRVEYEKARNDPAFIAEFEYELKHYVGRPSPVYHAKRLSEQYGGAQIYLKREDLNHTGAHKINNTIGQACWRGAWARSASSPRPAQASTAWPAATVAARYGMECVVYMGAEDVAAPGAQRLPDEAARRDRGAGVERFQNAERRAERSDARLGHQRRIDFLHPRHRCRPASLSRCWCATSSA